MRAPGVAVIEAFLIQAQLQRHGGAFPHFDKPRNTALVGDIDRKIKGALLDTGKGEDSLIIGSGKVVDLTVEIGSKCDADIDSGFSCRTGDRSAYLVRSHFGELKGTPFLAGTAARRQGGGVDIGCTAGE